MIVERVAKVLDQRIVQHVEEIIRGGPAVVLLQIEPAGAILVCHASTMLPLETTLAAACARCANGAASAVVASAVVHSTVRRVSVVFLHSFLPTNGYGWADQPRLDGSPQREPSPGPHDRDRLDRGRHSPPPRGHPLSESLAFNVVQLCKNVFPNFAADNLNDGC